MIELRHMVKGLVLMPETNDECKNIKCSECVYENIITCGDISLSDK